MAEKSYPVVVFPLSEDDGGGFVAYAPDLYGCMSDGATMEEAVANVQGAVGEWIDEMVRLERDIPEPGSAASEADKEWNNLVSLLRQEQDEALEERDRAYEALQAQHEHLKAAVTKVLSTIGSPEPRELPAWPMRPVAFTHVVVRHKVSTDGERRH